MMAQGWPPGQPTTLEEAVKLTLANLARAFAIANNHPDPEDYVAKVVEAEKQIDAPAAPAPKPAE